jgi:hypothetical protein
MITGAAMPRTAKVIRVAIMAQEVLGEMRQVPLDQSRQMRLQQILSASVAELSTCLPPRLADELGRLVRDVPAVIPSQAELALAHAQLTCWLEGVLWGIQARIEANETIDEFPPRRSDHP